MTSPPNSRRDADRQPEVEDSPPPIAVCPLCVGIGEVGSSCTGARAKNPHPERWRINLYTRADRLHVQTLDALQRLDARLSRLEVATPPPASLTDSERAEREALVALLGTDDLLTAVRGLLQTRADDRGVYGYVSPDGTLMLSAGVLQQLGIEQGGGVVVLKREDNRYIELMTNAQFQALLRGDTPTP